MADVKRDLLLVEWVDSHSDRGWRSLDELEAYAHPLHCRSVGWLVARKNGTLVLAGGLSGERNGNIIVCGNSYMAIPLRCIVKTTVLRKGER